MAVGEILFVNKTAKSGTLSRSRGLERAKIFSHVQRSSFNRSGTDTTESADSSASKTGPGTIGLRAPKSSTPKPTKSTKDSQLLETKQSIVLANTTLSLDRMLASSPDPFNTTAASCSYYMDCLFRFYAGNIVPQIYPVKSMAVISRDSTISMALQDPMLMNTLMCTTAAGIYFASRNQSHAIAAMSFKVKAIQCLHAKLAEPKLGDVSLSTVNTVALLLWIECLQGNANDLRFHTNGLNQLVGQVKDFSNTPLPVLTTVLACSYFCSAFLEVRPTIQPIILCSDRISPTAEALLQKTRNPFYKGLADRLFAPSNLSLLGPYLASIAIEQRANILLRDECAKLDTKTTYEDVQFAYTKEVWVDYSYASLGFEHTLTPAQDAVRITLFVFLQPIVLVTQPSAAFCRTMAKQLRTALEKSGINDLWCPRCDLLLWVLFIGAFLSVGEEQGPWFTKQLTTLIKFLGLETKKSVADVLKGFYYYPRYHNSALNVVWTEYELEEMNKSAKKLDQ